MAPDVTGSASSASARSDGPVEQTTRRRVPRLSMGTWLAIALLTVTIVSLLVSSLVTLTRTSELADEVIGARSRALLSIQADEVERYLRATQRHATALAASETVRDAAPRFAAAYEELDGTLDPAQVASATDDVAAYYRSDVIPVLEDIIGQSVGVRRLLPTSDAARYLQSHYSIPEPDAQVGLRERVDAGDGSAWSAAHAELHPVLSDIANQLGFEDLALITPDTATVVYTVAKLPDLGTNLEVGPYSGGVLAEGVNTVREQPEAGSVLTTDVAPYGPAAGRPASFVVAPVLDGDALVAVLAGRISLATIDRIMTAGGRWVDAGFGATGETFLVGRDGRMRSVSRAFVEDSAAYLRTVERAATATPAQRSAMAAADTTVPFQQVFTDAQMQAAAPDGQALIEDTGYLGREVETAVESLDVPGLDWVVVTQATRAQLEVPLATYRRGTAVAMALLVLTVAFFGVAWARRVFRPVRAVAERLQGIHEGRDTRPVPVGDRSPREFAVLTQAVDDMVAALDRRRADVDAAVAERRATMRALLPAAVVDRIEAGDRRVVDEIARATVVVLTVDGLGDLVRRGDAVSGRETLDRIVGTLDPLTERHGLVRVKLLGDAYFAGCGLDRPYLDHGPRAVSFALAAQQAVGRLAAEGPTTIRLSAGIASGPVTVGLAGSAMLVFDVWGDTANAAHHLAQQAPPGVVLVSEQTRHLLPADVSVSAYDSAGPPAWRVVDADVAATGEPTA